MRGLFSRTSAVVVGVLLFGVTACGSSTDDANGSAGSAQSGGSSKASGEQPESTPTPESAERQDLCAALDDATLNEVAAALGDSAEIENDSDDASTNPNPPAADTCDLLYTGRAVEPPDTGDNEIIVEGGDNSEGEIDLSLTVPAMSQADFDQMREKAREEAGAHPVTVNDVSGVGDAAYYSEIESKVLIGDRILGIDFPQNSEPEFVDVAEAIIPVVEELPAAPAEVTQPECDALTEAAGAALGEQNFVRRDSEGDSGDDPRPFCSWGTATKTFQTRVSSGDDDPQDALRQLRQDASVETVDVGDEGFLVTSPYRQVIFRDGDYHYEAAFWAVEEGEGSKQKMVAALQRFADGLE